MSTQGVGTFAINSKFSSGSLIFYEKAYGATTTGNVFTVGASAVKVGDTANDVDFQYYGTGSLSAIIDCGAATFTITGIATSFASGDVTIASGYGLNVGSSTQLTISDGDGATNLIPEVQALGVGTAFAGGAVAIATFNATNTLAVCPKLAFVKGAAATQVATTAVADNEVIGAIIGYASDGSDFETPVAAIELVVDDSGGPSASAIGGSIEFWTTADGGTTLTKALTLSTAQTATFVGAIVVDDTTESTSTTTGSIQTDGGLACAKDFYAGDDIFLTSAAVLNFNAGEVTITHSTNALAIAGAAITINDAGTDYDFRIESDNLAYAFYIDAGKDCIVIGNNTDISDVDYRLMVGNIAKTLATGEEAAIMYVAPSAATTTFTSGTHDYVATAYFAEPNITSGGAALTVASTVYIASAPTEGSANYGLYIASGGLGLASGAVTIEGGAFTFNDASADVDFRVESNNLAYALYVDGGKDCVVIGDNTDISDVDYRLMVGNVAKTLAQDQSASILYVAPTASTTEAGAGTHGYISSAYFKEPNITGGVAGCTVASTVYIADAPTEGSTNAALYIASGSLVTAGTVSITVADAGLTTTCDTLNATAGRIGKFSGSIAAGNLGDGYGAVEVDLTATGNLAGMVAGLSSWVNVTGTGVVGSNNMVCAQSNGIYADSGANTGAIVIFGMRCSGILTDAPTVFAPFSINTSNREITGLFEMNANPDVGYQANAGTSGAKVGDVPLFCDAAGQQYFVRIYNARG